MRLGGVDQALLRHVRPRRWMMSPTGEPMALDRARRCFARLLERPGVADEQRDDRLAVDLLAEARARAGASRSAATQVSSSGQPGHESRYSSSTSGASSPRHAMAPADDLGPDRMQLVLECRRRRRSCRRRRAAPRTDPAFSLSLARTIRPSAVTMSIGLHAVAGPAVSSREIAEPAAQRQPGDSRVGDEAEHGGKTVQLGLPVDIAEQAAGLRRARCASPDRPTRRASATCRAAARRRTRRARRCCARHP